VAHGAANLLILARLTSAVCRKAAAQFLAQKRERVNLWFKEHYWIGLVIQYILEVIFVTYGGYVVILNLGRGIQLENVTWSTVETMWVAEVPILMLLGIILGERRRGKIEENYLLLELVLRTFDARGVGSLKHLSIYKINDKLEEDFDKPPRFIVNSNRTPPLAFRLPKRMVPLLDVIDRMEADFKTEADILSYFMKVGIRFETREYEMKDFD
jgi:hypothetical protein